MSKLTSVSMNYPERGKWGDSKYRGNCSGYVIRDIIDQYMPKQSGIFIDACMGSGTSKDVCDDLFPGIQYLGLDLRYGFDYTKDSISKKVMQEYGALADVCFSHYSYFDLIYYSGNMWGEPNEADHSRCDSEADFLEKSRIALLNQRDATKEGGVYTTLIGDRRSKGQFSSYQADFINMMPRSELKSVCIKQQHNCTSDATKYAHMKHPAILHEYLLVWERTRQSFVQICWDKAVHAKNEISMSWAALVRIALMKLGGQDVLARIYDEVEKVAGDKLASNPTWKATVRRTLQQNFENVQRGVWAIA